MRRWLMFVPLVLSLAIVGCGETVEEPTEIPKSPPKGKSLPRFVEREIPRLLLV